MICEDNTPNERSDEKFYEDVNNMQFSSKDITKFNANRPIFSIAFLKRKYGKQFSNLMLDPSAPTEHINVYTRRFFVLKTNKDSLRCNCIDVQIINRILFFQNSPAISSCVTWSRLRYANRISGRVAVRQRAGRWKTAGDASRYAGPRSMAYKRSLVRISSTTPRRRRVVQAADTRSARWTRDNERWSSMLTLLSRRYGREKLAQVCVWTQTASWSGRA